MRASRDAPCVEREPLKFFLEMVKRNAAEGVSFAIATDRICFR